MSKFFENYLFLVASRTSQNLIISYTFCVSTITFYVSVVISKIFGQKDILICHKIA